MGTNKRLALEKVRVIRRRAKARPGHFVKINQMTLPKYLVSLQKAGIEQELIVALAQKYKKQEGKLR